MIDQQMIILYNKYGELVLDVTILSGDGSIPSNELCVMTSDDLKHYNEILRAEQLKETDNRLKTFVILNMKSDNEAIRQFCNYVLEHGCNNITWIRHEKYR